MRVPSESPSYSIRESLQDSLKVMFSYVFLHKFNPLIKYSQTNVTSVIPLGVVVEEDIEGEQPRGFWC